MSPTLSLLAVLNGAALVINTSMVALFIFYGNKFPAMISVFGCVVCGFNCGVVASAARREEVAARRRAETYRDPDGGAS